MNPNIRLGTPEKRRRQTRMARHASRLADLREFTDQLFERDRIFPDPCAGAVCASAGLASTPTKARAATDFTIMRVLHSPAGCRHAQLNRMRPHLCIFLEEPPQRLAQFSRSKTKVEPQMRPKSGHRNENYATGLLGGSRVESGNYNNQTGEKHEKACQLRPRRAVSGRCF